MIFDKKRVLDPIPLSISIAWIGFLSFFLTINIDPFTALISAICIVSSTYLSLHFGRLLPISASPFRFACELGTGLSLVFSAFMLASWIYHGFSFVPDYDSSLTFLSKVQIVLSILICHLMLHLYKFYGSKEKYNLEASVASMLIGLSLIYGEQDLFYNTNEYLSEFAFFSLLIVTFWLIFRQIQKTFSNQSPYYLLSRGFLLISIIIPLDFFFNYLFLKITYDISLYKDYWYVEVPLKIVVLMTINFAEGIMTAKDRRSDAIADRIKIKNGDRVNIIPIEDIAYFCVADGINYLNTKDRRKFVVDESLSNLKERLNQHIFFRANRQLLIARSAIASYRSVDNKKIKVSLNGTPENFIISRITAPDFRKWISE